MTQLPKKPDPSLPEAIQDEYSTIRSMIYSKHNPHKSCITRNDYPLVEALAMAYWNKKEILKDLSTVVAPDLKADLRRQFKSATLQLVQLSDALFLTPSSRAKKQAQADKIVAQSEDEVEDKGY